MFIYTSTGTAAHKAIALSHIALSPDAQPMAENMFRALWSWLICVGVTIIVSYMTTPKTDAELNGLVYGATVIPHDGSTTIWQKPIFWAGVVSRRLHRPQHHLLLSDLALRTTHYRKGVTPWQKEQDAAKGSPSGFSSAS